MLRVDAAYVVKGMKSDRRTGLLAGGNGDLWEILLDAIQQRSLCVTCAKVKAHAERQVLQGTVGLQEFLGNALADAGAGAAAEAAVSSVDAQQTSLWEERAFLIARRLAVVEASLWPDEPRLVPAPPPLQRQEPPRIPVAVSGFQASIDNMGHRLRRRGDFLTCSRCRRRRKLSAHKFWASVPCAGAAQQTRQDCGGSEPPPCQPCSAAKRGRLQGCELAADDLIDDDPFGHALLGIDDDGEDGDLVMGSARHEPAMVAARPSKASACTARRTTRSEEISTRPAADGPSEAAVRFEALRLRVRARELEAAAGTGNGMASSRALLMPLPLARERFSDKGAGEQVDPAACCAGQLVTPAKRRRLLTAQRAIRRDDAAAARLANEAAWRVMAKSLPQVATHESQEVVPFPVDGSHECITCGGFVGCIRCGSVVSAQLRSALSSPCRGFCPPGATGPVQRLVNRLLPRGEAWPNGEIEPKPKRCRR